ncbi:MAG TPA: MBL fold metallo-hydrolase, partial [Nitrosopumilaceae archaeon]|nr:MBL fold metallo-hydrolase [Nitrosopumilaceae archaeon]
MEKMKISFLGTRGNIKIKSKLHRRHTVTVITYRGTRVAIDCGLNWLRHVDEIHPDAFVITHAHNDHIDGLQNGSPCPVYATQATWEYLGQFPIKNGYVINYQEPFSIGSLIFEAFFVEHSFWAFAVGYRITAGATTIFCVHDLLSIKNRTAALKDVQLYIGDGASLNRPIIRYHDKIPFGHTTIMEQIKWCKKARIPRAIFTHCGSQIV